MPPLIVNPEVDGYFFIWCSDNPLVCLIPARIVLGVYLVIDNILPFMTRSVEGGGVAYGAHIGGFMSGLGMALAIDRLPSLLRMKGTTPKVSRKRADLVDAVTDIVRSIDRNDLEHAASRFTQLDSRRRRGQLSTSNILAIGEYLLTSGATDEALTAFRQLIAERPSEKGLDRAYLGAGRALLHKPRCETSAWHYFMSAIDLAKTAEVAEEARRYMKIIEKDNTKL